jgi:hypothetical protein
MLEFDKLDVLAVVAGVTTLVTANACMQRIK